LRMVHEIVFPWYPSEGLPNSPTRAYPLLVIIKLNHFLSVAGQDLEGAESTGTPAPRNIAV